MVNANEVNEATNGKIIIDLIAISEDAKTYDESAIWGPFKNTSFENIVQKLNAGAYDDMERVRSIRKRYQYLEQQHEIEWRRSKVAFFDFDIHGANTEITSIEMGITLIEGDLLQKCKNGISIDCDNNDTSTETHLSVFHYFALKVKFFKGLLIHPNRDISIKLMKDKWFILKGLCVENFVLTEEELASELLGIVLQWVTKQVINTDEIMSRSIEISLSPD
jgi:hypothetical protein